MFDYIRLSSVIKYLNEGGLTDVKHNDLSLPGKKDTEVIVQNLPWKYEVIYEVVLKSSLFLTYFIVSIGL